MHVGEVRREQMGAFFSILSADGRRVGHPPAPPRPSPLPSPPWGGSRGGDRSRDLSRISLKSLLSTIPPTSDLPQAERLATARVPLAPRPGPATLPGRRSRCREMLPFAHAALRP